MPEKNYTNRFFRFIRSRVNLKTPGQMLLKTVIVILLSFYPQSAYSQVSQSDGCNVTGDILFKATNNVSIPVCIFCAGPWLRSSPTVRILADPCTFYAAENTLFSPVGLWSCDVLDTLRDGDCSDFKFNSISFCLDTVRKGTIVDLEVVEDDVTETPKLTVNFPSPPCTDSAVPSFLGDNFKQEKLKRDIDIFLFNGTEGDEIKLALEADPQPGNNGGNASFGITGNSLNEFTTGTLPLEINTILPADGEYSIMVEQPKVPEEQRFRGGYTLRLESSVGLDLIKPTNNVEK